mmetsp:Transcript_2344/g.3599  ORF Transcript_2344/g.3599 Transcript_2344/m.3599 type:complete len:298 (+) Transcript_2344:502-1395(+)
MIECFERASTPFIDQTERKRLLTFVVVGGGPTNVEFASELHDFLRKDVAKWYPDLHDHVRVVVIEASGHILGSFNESLVEYVEKLFASRNIEVFTKTVVEEVKENVAVLGDGKELPFGVMVWSTGIKQMDLVRNMPDEVCRSQGGRLQVDEHLRLQGEDGKGGITPLGEGTVFAIGDCAGDISRPLPALAQVASQQGKYLAHFLNNHKEEASKDIPNAPPFKYAHLGSMASVGEWKGVIDASDIDKSSKDPAKLKGFLAFALWRAAYWTKQVSFTNKLLIPMYWFKSAVFGRDISRF